MKATCAFFGISRASYYAWLKRIDRLDPDLARMKIIEEAYLSSRRSYGYRRIKIWIEKKYGLQINHKAVLRLMNKMGIQSVARKRKPYPKWYEIKTQHRYSNHLNRDFIATKPNQKWVTDITYIHTNQGWAYLSTVKDLFDGFIVAHPLGKHNSVALVTQTLRKALKNEKVADGTILHSDQGYQYCSHAYYGLTKEFKIRPSMSRKGNCWDNAPMENFFGHLKEECLKQYQGLSYLEVKVIIDEYIYFYNYERMQLKTKQAPYQLRCLLV